MNHGAHGECGGRKEAFSPVAASLLRGLNQIHPSRIGPAVGSMRSVAWISLPDTIEPGSLLRRGGRSTFARLLWPTNAKLSNNARR